MNLGEFRAATADLPDEYEIVSHPGDATFWETDMRADVLKPVAGAPGVIILDGGQEVTEQYLIPIRTDLDDEVEMRYGDVPDDWEIKWQSTGEWVKATVGVGTLPDDLVDARPGAAYYERRKS